MDAGQYTGNGNEQTITTHERPKMVAIWREDGKYNIMKMGGSPATGQAVNVAGLVQSIRIKNGGITMESDGFTVGNNDAVNEDGKVYNWAVII